MDNGHCVLDIRTGKLFVHYTNLFKNCSYFQNLEEKFIFYNQKCKKNDFENYVPLEMAIKYLVEKNLKNQTEFLNNKIIQIYLKNTDVWFLPTEINLEEPKEIENIFSNSQFLIAKQNENKNIPKFDNNKKNYSLDKQRFSKKKMISLETLFEQKSNKNNFIDYNNNILTRVKKIFYDFENLCKQNKILIDPICFATIMLSYYSSSNERQGEDYIKRLEEITRTLNIDINFSQEQNTIELKPNSKHIIMNWCHEKNISLNDFEAFLSTINNNTKKFFPLQNHLKNENQIIQSNISLLLNLTPVLFNDTKEITNNNSGEKKTFQLFKISEKNEFEILEGIKNFSFNDPVELPENFLDEISLNLESHEVSQIDSTQTLHGNNSQSNTQNNTQNYTENNTQENHQNNSENTMQGEEQKIFKWTTIRIKNHKKKLKKTIKFPNNIGSVYYKNQFNPQNEFILGNYDFQKGARVGNINSALILGLIELYFRKYFLFIN